MAEIQDLDDRYLHYWLVGLGVGVAVVVGTAWISRPVNGFLLAVVGILVVTLLSVMIVDLALGNRLSAVGNVVAATGWVLLAIGSQLEFPDGYFEAGLAVLFAGAAITLVANHGSTLTSMVSR